MLLPRLDVMDLNYTLYRIADDVVFHGYVSRTLAAETVGCHPDSSLIILPDYNFVVDWRRQEALHLSKETNLINNFASATYVKKKGSVAFSLSTLRNMMCCVRFQGT